MDPDKKKTESSQVETGTSESDSESRELSDLELEDVAGGDPDDGRG
jgi:hypothetical protein